MIANPRAAQQFREAAMRRSKTDELDAASLCDYAERMPFEAWEPPEAVSVELRAITRRIQALTAKGAPERRTACTPKRPAGPPRAWSRTISR